VKEIVSVRLEELENVIDAGLKTFVDVGNALLEIRDSRLYREGWGTFEEYCQDRWEFNSSRARQLISAAEVTRNLESVTIVTLPATESQARPLTALEPEAQRQAWQTAVETAPNGKVTAAHVKSVVDEMTGRTVAPAISPVPQWDDLKDKEDTPTKVYVEVIGESGDVFTAERYTIEPDEEIGVIKKTPHVAHNSGNNEWYTPEPFILAARAVMGGIDCDPATSEDANRIVGASTIYTAETNGLVHNWRGRVWMNPPYASPLISQFCEKLSLEFQDGRTSEAIALVNNATETVWFAALIDSASAVVFPQSRVKFWQPDGTMGAPLQGQAIIYLGGKPKTFLAEFKTFGWGAQL